jgi:hypothetical protein
MAMNLKPKTCPRCGREAFFWYTNETEALRGSPLCWGESESDCPGWPLTGSAPTSAPTTPPRP